jgi:hypothetical protein
VRKLLLKLLQGSRHLLYTWRVGCRFGDFANLVGESALIARELDRKLRCLSRQQPAERQNY